MVEIWNGLNFKYLHESGGELYKCGDYIPLCLSPYYDVEKRIDFLKKNGLYFKISEIEKEKREDFLESNDKINWDINDVLSFIKNHEEYYKIIKEEIK